MRQRGTKDSNACLPPRYLAIFFIEFGIFPDPGVASQLASFVELAREGKHLIAGHRA